MKYDINPTTKPEKDTEGVELPIKFVLEDKDFLLIEALNNLSNEIMKLRLSK